MLQCCTLIILGVEYVAGEAVVLTVQKESSVVEETRRCGSVYLSVVVLRLCEVCCVYEGYVGSAVVLYI